VLVSVIALVVAANVALAGVRSLVGGEPGGPASSSFGTAGDGLEGYADLLRAGGREVVRLRQAPAAGDLPAGATVVVADPAQLGAAEVEALGQLLESGGRLVLAGAATEPLLAAATGHDVTHDDGDSGELQVWVPSPDTGSAGELAGDRGGRWRDVGPLLPLAGDDRGAAIVTGPAGAGGAGQVVALADADLLHNDNLARADNAALGLGLAGPGGAPVVFLESVHGFGGSGADAVPDAWKRALAGVALALVVGVWAAAARFGPPEPQARHLRPPRRDHVDAVAAALDRAGASDVDTVPHDPPHRGADP
jgi:hypothetical protein